MAIISEMKVSPARQQHEINEQQQYKLRERERGKSPDFNDYQKSVIN